MFIIFLILLRRRGSASTVFNAGLTRQTTRNSAAGTSARMRGAFVVCQFAVALVLLAEAGLLIRSLLAVQSVDSGFGDLRVVMAHLRFNNALPRERRTGLYQGAIDRIRQLPGVRTVGAIGTMFWDGDGGKFGLRAVDGHADTPRDQWESLTWTTVSGDYFQALGVPLLRGRFFRDTDTRNAPPVLVINERLARREFENQDPIGERLLIQEIVPGKTELGPEIPWQVVGVVRDEKVNGIADDRSTGVYVSNEQSPAYFQTLSVRTSADPLALQKSIAAAIHGVNKDQALTDIRTVDQIKERSMANNRLQAALLGVFATVALLLAGIGLYGVISYSVAQRTQEIGIRAALGATEARLLQLVLNRASVLTVLGLVMGILGSLGLTRLMASLLYGVGARDPATMLLVGTLLALVAVIACYVPARRATKIDPLLAVRYE